MNIDNQNLIKIGKDYINQLNNLSNYSEKVTDKLPVNFKLNVQIDSSFYYIAEPLFRDPVAGSAGVNRT